MKLKILEALKAMGGEPLMDLDRATNKQIQLTLRHICVEALLRPLDTDVQLSVMQKFQMGELAHKIYNATEEMDITPEEAVLIKERVGKSFPVLIVWNVSKLME